MSHNVPPTIEKPKTIIGVGTRELLIVGIGLVLAILCFVSIPGLTFKIAFGVIFAALGIGLAFGRDPLTGNTFEKYLMSLFDFNSRVRFHQRGAGDFQQYQGYTVNVGTNEQIAVEEPSSRWNLFTMEPFDLGSGLFLKIFSLGVLAGLITWIWSGGMDSVIKLYGMK